MDSTTTSRFLHALVVGVKVFAVVWILERFAFFKEGSTPVRAVIMLVAVFGVTFVVNMFWPVS